MATKITPNTVPVRPRIVAEIRYATDQVDIDNVTAATIEDYFGWMLDHVAGTSCTDFIFWDYDSVDQGDFPGDPLTFDARCPVVSPASDAAYEKCRERGISLGFTIRGANLPAKVFYLQKRYPNRTAVRIYVDSDPLKTTTAISTAFPAWLLEWPAGRESAAVAPLVEFNYWGAQSFSLKRGWQLRIDWAQPGVQKNLPAWLKGCAATVSVSLCNTADIAAGVAEVFAYGFTVLQFTCHAFQVKALDAALDAMYGPRQPTETTGQPGGTTKAPTRVGTDDEETAATAA